jgi:hypothetical protein
MELDATEGRRFQSKKQFKGKSRMTCYACNQKGHMARDCRSKNKVPRRQFNMMQRHSKEKEPERNETKEGSQDEDWFNVPNVKDTFISVPLVKENKKEEAPPVTNKVPATHETPSCTVRCYDACLIHYDTRSMSSRRSVISRKEKSKKKMSEVILARIPPTVRTAVKNNLRKRTTICHTHATSTTLL